VFKIEDYLYFVDRALDGMIEIVLGLGDDLANRKPDLPGANSPYQILAHCLGVVSFWGGHLVAGRTVERDRPGEFTARGPVTELAERADRVRRDFRADVHTAQPDQPLRSPVPPDYVFADRDLTQGTALVHILEELCQHHGHAEITRDLLEASRLGA
jgi:Protein of unknown function (DUF664)